MAEGAHLETIFQKAAEYAKTHMGSLQTDQILNLYGLFKQATVGKNTTPKPKFWNITDKQKWEAWNKQGEKSSKTAKEEYIALISSTKPTWLNEPTKTPSWVVFSTLQPEEPSVPESEQDIFYWVKENNEALLKQSINSTNLSLTDAEGLALLHWAADRGHVNIIRLLLISGAEANVQDLEGQTPLHYAASCGHADAVAALLSGGASILITDEDGNKPGDVAATAEIVEIIASKTC